MKTALAVVVGTFVLVLGRPGSADDLSSADRKALQGTWRGWVVEGKGEQANQGIVHLEVVVKDNTMVAQRLDRTKDAALGEGTYKLALAESKKTIDATRTSNPGKGQINRGIYAIEGDTFKWCVGAPNKDRPEDFTTRRGQFLIILKRHDAKGEAEKGK